jgi:acid stress chaperone HdeA
LWILSLAREAREFTEFQATRSTESRTRFADESNVQLAQFFVFVENKKQRKEISMYLQRLAIGVVAATLVAGSTVAFGQSAGTKKPLGKMTCEDFIGIEETFKPKVVYWAVAYGQGGKPESAGINVEGTEKMIPVLIEACKKAPKESFWQKVKAEVKKLEKKL